MKELVFAWKIIELLSSTGIVSKSLIRSVNPETYTFYCVYSDEEVNNHDNLEGSKYIKHIVTCRDSSCNYYQRLVNNTRPNGEATGTVVLAVATGALYFVSGIAAPFTFGLSLLAVGALSAGSLVGADLLIENSIKKTIKEVENELKEKWENERRLTTERNNLR